MWYGNGRGLVRLRGLPRSGTRRHGWRECRPWEVATSRAPGVHWLSSDVQRSAEESAEAEGYEGDESSLEEKKKKKCSRWPKGRKIQNRSNWPSQGTQAWGKAATPHQWPARPETPAAKKRRQKREAEAAAGPGQALAALQAAGLVQAASSLMAVPRQEKERGRDRRSDSGNNNDTDSEVESLWEGGEEAGGSVKVAETKAWRRGIESLLRKGMNAREALELSERAAREVFHLKGLRPLQKRLLPALLSSAHEDYGRDILAVAGTGAGKSLLYLLPALLSPSGGVTVVVAPLIALIKDQVRHANNVGLPTASLFGRPPAALRRQLLATVASGKVSLFFVTPEQATSADVLLTLHMLEEKGKLDRIAVDEAHCISEWGHDFRPKLRRLERLRREFISPHFLCCTATATKETQEDILACLGMRTPLLLSSPVGSRTISYRVLEKSDSSVEDLAALVAKRWPKRSGLVYCLTKAETEEVAQALRAKGISAAHHHSDLGEATREAAQAAWIAGGKAGGVDVLAATAGFGMGVSRANVAFVLHHSLPTSLEGFFQQSGRTGRGAPGASVLYYSPIDRQRAERVLSYSSQSTMDIVGESHLLSDSSHLGRRLEKLDDVTLWCINSKTCRAVALGQFFGEEEMEPCGNCDVCISPDKMDTLLDSQAMKEGNRKTRKSGTAGQ